MAGVSVGGTASGIVLILFGVWVLLQTLVGGLATRLLASGSGGGSTTPTPALGAPVGTGIGAAVSQGAGLPPLPGKGSGPEPVELAERRHRRSRQVARQTPLTAAPASPPAEL